MSKEKPVPDTSAQAPATTPAPAKAPDINHGRGGMYTVISGVRQRVVGTKAAHEAKKG